jgi:hypothetical protein
MPSAGINDASPPADCRSSIAIAMAAPAVCSVLQRLVGTFRYRRLTVGGNRL